MMDRLAWRAAVHDLPVFDTHTHLNMPGVPLPAQNIWDIVHYFWFQQELWAVGYPRGASQMSETDRMPRFVEAFNRVRNTTWHHMVRRICEDLYGVPLVDDDGICTPDHVAAVDEAVRAAASQPGWARSVADRLGIRRIAVNNLRDVPFRDLPEVAIAVPSWDDFDSWSERLLQTANRDAVCEEARQAIAEHVGMLAAQGIRGMRVPADPFEALGSAAVDLSAGSRAFPGTRPYCEAFLVHLLLETLSVHGMFAQLFLGIHRDVAPGSAMAVNDPRRIINLYPLFERYACGFELVIGAPQNNMDAAQAARIYPNVHLGGLWWYNFRRSTYRHALQVRLEAVPAEKSAIIASDARCIEWAYGKILMVKWLLADFLYDQTNHGWLTEDEALWVAREWLHDAPSRRYE